MDGTDERGDGGTGTWFEGVIPNLQRRFENTESEFVKTRLHQYTSEQPCAVCGGTRLKNEALAVRLHSDTPGPVAAPLPGARAVQLPGYSIHDVVSPDGRKARRIFPEPAAERRGDGDRRADRAGNFCAGLGFMLDVGLGYLTLDRKTATLSGGEAQRIRLATQVGSGLVGVCYVLDEPTIGLHQRDNARLIRTLRRLREIGNTVIMVEHDEECIRSSDYLIDIGPGAGAHGGEVVCEGPMPDVLKNTHSTTVKYLDGRVCDRRAADAAAGRSGQKRAGTARLPAEQSEEHRRGDSRSAGWFA